MRRDAVNAPGHGAYAPKSPLKPCRFALLLFPTLAYSRGIGSDFVTRSYLGENYMLYAIVATFLILSVVSLISGHVASN